MSVCPAGARFAARRMNSTPAAGLLWYWASSLLLAVLLYVPVERLIWVLRVRRRERKLGRKCTGEEREHERRGARIAAGVIAVTVAFLYNRTLLHA